MFNGVAGWPALAFDRAARPRSFLARDRMAAKADGLAQPHSPPPPRRREPSAASPARIETFSIGTTTAEGGAARSSPSGCKTNMQTSVCSFDPFLYPTLTYVRLSRRSQPPYCRAHQPDCTFRAGEMLRRTGGKDAQQSPVHLARRSQTLRDLRRKIWPHPALLLPDPTLFKEAR